MANPIQYTPQFVPTDFNTLRDVLGMYRQDLAGRDQMFDQGAASRDSMLTELYNQETYDPDVLKSEVDKFSTKMDELVTRYGGDYGAAAKEIARLGTKESSNPLYQLNRRKVEQVKNLEQLIARNPNLMALKDPRKIKLSQNIAPEDLQYEVADPANIQESINSIYGDLGKQIRESGLQNSNIPGILQAITTKGLTKEELDSMMKDENTFKTILGRNPQLQKYMDNPEVAEWFKTQVTQGLRGLEGGSQRQFVDNPNYGRATSTKTTESSPRMLQSFGTPLVPRTIKDLGTTVFKEAGDKAAIKEAEALGIPGVKTLDDLREMTKSEMQVNDDIPKNTPLFPGTGFKYVKRSDYYNQAKQAIKNIESKLGTEEYGTKLRSYNLNTLASTSTKDITAINNIYGQLNDRIKNIKTKLVPFGDGSEKTLKNLSKDIRVTEIVPNFKESEAGLVLFLEGTDDDGNPVQTRAYLDPKSTNEESQIVGFLSDLNPMIGINYTYAKLPEKGGKGTPSKDDYINGLIQVFNSTDDQQMKESISEFFKTIDEE